MGKKRVRVYIYGSEYYFLTDGNPEDVIELAEKIDTEITELMQGQGTSLGRALVSVSMGAEERARQAEKSAELALAQLKEHLAETARCRREAERLRTELQQREAKILELTAELAARKPAEPEEWQGDKAVTEVAKDGTAVPAESAAAGKEALSSDDFIRMIDTLSKSAENGAKE